MALTSDLVKEQLVADASDFFNRKLKFATYTFILFYIFVFVFNKCIYNIFEVNHMNKSVMAKMYDKETAHIAADSGLIMNFNDFRNYCFSRYHNLHAIFALILFMIVLFQKFSVTKMALYTKSNNSRIDILFYNTFFKYHAFVGKLGIFCVIVSIVPISTNLKFILCPLPILEL